MIDLTNIKNIIFDLGGVILNINYDLTVAAFEELNLENFDTLFTKMQQSDLFIRLETGEISPQEFRLNIKKISNKNITDSQIDKAWNAMLLDLPLERIELLKRLSKKYSLYLLSNTNAIHIEAFTKILHSSIGSENISHIFNKVYYSHQIGMRKPNADIFQYVLSDNRLKPSETLFIDDSPQHIQAAKELGINTFHITDKLSINAVFEK